MTIAHCSALCPEPATANSKVDDVCRGPSFFADPAPLQQMTPWLWHQYARTTHQRDQIASQHETKPCSDDVAHWSSRGTHHLIQAGIALSNPLHLWNETCLVPTMACPHLPIPTGSQQLQQGHNSGMPHTTVLAAFDFHAHDSAVNGQICAGKASRSPGQLG